MNHSKKLAKIITITSKKQKDVNFRRIGILTVLGVATTSIIVPLLIKNCCEEIKNIDINNLDDNLDNINEAIEKHNTVDNNFSKEKIMETLENVGEESLGDVGMAMENTLDDLHEEEKNKMR